MFECGLGQAIPHELRIVVGVRIDEPGREHEALRVDRFGGIARNVADRDDPPVTHGDGAGERRAARTVADAGILDEQIETHNVLSNLIGDGGENRPPFIPFTVQNVTYNIPI